MSGEETKAGFGNDPLLAFEYLNPQGRALLLERYAQNAVDEKLTIDWKATPYNRIALMNYLAGGRPETRYLEIGCDLDELFHALPLADKTGVDPERGGTHRVTSDAFFAENDRQFDLMFLDGLHTYEQLHRDVDNALAALAPGGWIGIHDLAPRDWKEEHVPRIAGAWTGDVWKVAVELAHTEGVQFKLVMIDHGVGLVRRLESDGPAPVLPDLSAELADAGFATYMARRPEIERVNWDRAVAWVDRVRAQTAKANAAKGKAKT